MIIFIMSIIIFIIAFDLGREWEKLERIYLSSQSETKYLKIEEGENSITISNVNVPSGYKVIYDKDTPIKYK